MLNSTEYEIHLAHKCEIYHAHKCQNGILTFLSMINTSVGYKAKKSSFFSILVFIMSPPFRVGRHIVFPRASICLSVCLSVRLSVRLSVCHKSCRSIT